MGKTAAVLGLVVGAGLLSAAAAAGTANGAVDHGELFAALDAARGVVATSAPNLGNRLPSGTFMAESFVPARCVVESWCLAKATDCFLGVVTQPTGLWQADAQYSIVRKAVALCHDPYGRPYRTTLTGPVEPVLFRSPIETTREAAVSEAIRLCQVYRQDWVAAAPSCQP